jgi:phospholipid/cholesterol/gamma-HCH transport system ATP-binding protein
MKKRAGLARALVLDPEIILFDEPDSGLDPVRTAFLNELILDLNRQLNSTFIVVTHDIATARRVADFIGMLYRRNLVRFGPAKDMFDSDIPVVRQFLSGDTEGPIGMSEEKDQTKPQLGDEGGQDGQQQQQGQQQQGQQGQGQGSQGDGVRSTSGMTAQETEEAERAAGAPQEEAGAGPRRKQA